MYKERAAAGTYNRTIEFIISPPDGKVVAAADFDCTGETSSPEDDCLNHANVTFANTSEADALGNFGTDNTIKVTAPINFTHGNADQSIVLNITGVETSKKYTVNGTYSTRVVNATPSEQSNVAYTATGEAGTTVTIDLETGDASTNAKTFTASNGYNFSGSPVVADVWGDGSMNYEISKANTGNPVTSTAITIKYTFPHENIEGDEILFHVVTTKVIGTSSNNLYDFSLDQTTLSPNGETRTLSISGDPGAQVIVDAKNASNTSIISGPVTLTIPTGAGAAGTVTQDIEFPLSSSTTTYTVTMTETGANRFDMTNSFSGATGSAGSRVKTITFNQRKNTVVTFTASTANSSLTIDGNATSSSITSTGKAESEPSPFDEVNLSYVVSSGNNGSITANSATTSYTFDNTKWTGTLANHQKTLSNGSVVQFKGLKAVMNNNTATITGTALVVKYGTADDTTTMDVDNFLAVVGTAPTAVAQTVTVGNLTPIVITLAGTDPQGGNLDFATTSIPYGGNLSGITEGSGLTSTITYTPTTSGPFSTFFYFTVTDGTTVSSPAKVTINVQGESHAWTVDNTGVADAFTACNTPWATGSGLDTVYASTNYPQEGMEFFTNSSLTTPYNPDTNGTSGQPNNSHRFMLGTSAGGACGYHGKISSVGLVSVVYDCCNT